MIYRAGPYRVLSIEDDRVLFGGSIARSARDLHWFACSLAIFFSAQAVDLNDRRDCDCKPKLSG
eukprot:3120485-Rhodomonas_salina.4